MRKPNRTPREKLEDMFVDMTLDQQANELEHLADLHRWSKKERARARRPEEARQGRVEVFDFRECRACGGTGQTCPAGPSDAPMNTCADCLGTGHTA